ncbi:MULTISPECIES: type II secretion system protein [Aphanothece]|uniref:type II secretion system protein n=1 Tax=Aphanothece TaxID=1121 RepID=UPI00398EB2F6
MTLPEILVALVITAVIIAGVGNVLLNHMFDARRVERAQRLREDSNRINYLIAIEAAEASAINTDPGLQVANCNEDNGEDAEFSLTIPWQETTTYGPGAESSTVYYYNQTAPDGVATIKRCGPKVTKNGRLIHSNDTYQSGTVYRGGEIVLPTDCSVSVDSSGSLTQGGTTSRQLVYNLQIGSLSDQLFARCQVAKAKTVFVCNPPIPNSDGSFTLDVGDCPPPASP